MELAGKVVVVTGGGGGIGEAMCRRFAAAGAAGIVVADRDQAAAERVAAAVGGIPVRADVAVEEDTRTALETAETRYGPVDLFCANAGIFSLAGPEANDAEWDRMWRVNVMSQVYAARHYLPMVLSRGEGYLLHTASAAGLLSNIGAAPYSVTKHAVVALAEWLSITYGDDGLKVSCLCPMGVRTAMLQHDSRGYLTPGALDPEEVATSVVEGIGEERFFILPHPEVAEYYRRRATDPERWLDGMRRLRATLFPDGEQGR